MRLKSLRDPILDAQQVLTQRGPLTTAELVAELKEQFGWHERPTKEGIKVALGIFFYKRADGKVTLDPS